MGSRRWWIGSIGSVAQSNLIGQSSQMDRGRKSSTSSSLHLEPLEPADKCFYWIEKRKCWHILWNDNASKVVLAWLITGAHRFDFRGNSTKSEAGSDWKEQKLNWSCKLCLLLTFQDPPSWSMSALSMGGFFRCDSLSVGGSLIFLLNLWACFITKSQCELSNICEHTWSRTFNHKCSSSQLLLYKSTFSKNWTVMKKAWIGDKEKQKKENLNDSRVYFILILICIQL